jgi:hypothetical protein
LSIYTARAHPTKMKGKGKTYPTLPPNTTST